MSSTGAASCGQEDEIDDRAPQHINRYNPVSGEFLGVYRVEGLALFPFVFEPRGLDASDERRLLAVVRQGFCESDFSSILGISRLTGATTQLVDGSQFKIGGAEDVVAGLAGNFYVSNRKTKTLFGFNASSGAATPFLEKTLDAKPLGLALGPGGDGSLYVLTDNSDVRRITLSGDVEVFVATGDGGLDVDDSADLVFGPDGDLYVANPGGDNVLRYDGRNGAFRDEFVSSGSGQLDEPVGLAFGAAGSTLFVTSRSTNSVLKFNAKTGKFRDTLATPSLEDGFLERPTYLALATTEIPPLTQLQPSEGSLADVPALLSWEPLDHPKLVGYEVVFRKSDATEFRERVTTTFFVLDDGTLKREGLDGQGDVLLWRVEAIGRVAGSEVVLAESATPVSFTVSVGTSGSGTVTVISGLVFSDLTQAALVGAQVAVTANSEHVAKGSSGGLHVFTTKDNTGYVVIALNTDPYPIVLQGRKDEFVTEEIEIARGQARDSNDDGKDNLPGIDIVMKPERVETDGIGVYRDSGSLFLLRNALSQGSADETFPFGPGGKRIVPISGDWDNDGIDTVGVFIQKKREFRLINEAGKQTHRFRFGKKRKEIPVAGDWNGNGRDTIGTYNPATRIFNLRNNNGEGEPAFSFRFGPKRQIPLVGDWDGDGRDSIGVYDASKGLFRIRNENNQGPEDRKFRFGPKNKGWLPMAGDWNMDGKDTVSIYHPEKGRFMLKNRNGPGSADLEFKFGPRSASAVPLAGDWDGR